MKEPSASGPFERAPSRRALFGLERLMWLVPSEIPVNGACRFRVRGPLPEARLRAGIDELQRRHPLLRSRLTREQGEAVFTTSEFRSIPVRVIGRADKDMWRRLAETELLECLEVESGPLMRIVILRLAEADATDILMIVHHAIMDAVASTLVIRDLLLFVAGSEELLVPLPMLPPLPELLVEGEDTPRPCIPAPNPSPVIPLQQASAPTFKIREVTLEPELTRGIIAACTRRKVTVHSLLCASFAQQIARSRGERPNVIISCPVNLRPRLRVDVGDAVGLYMTMVDVLLESGSSSSVWSFARAFQARLRERSGPTAVDSLFALDSMLKSLTRGRELPIPLPRHDLSVSNLGQIPIPTRYGDLELESLHGLSCAPGEAVVFVVSVQGRMCLTLGTREMPSAAVAEAQRVFFATLDDLSRLATRAGPETT